MSRVTFDIDIEALIASMQNIDDSINGLSDAVLLRLVTQDVFNQWKKKFAEDVDKKAVEAMSESKYELGKYHHLYEAGQIGEASGRLFDYVFSKEVRMHSRSELFAAVDFTKPSIDPPVFGVKNVSPTQLYKAAGESGYGNVFFDKARRWEEGTTWTLSDASKRGLFVHSGSLRLFEPPAGTYSSPEQNQGALAGAHDDFFAKEAGEVLMEVVVDISRVIEREEARLARDIAANNVTPNRNARKPAGKQMAADMEKVART